MSALPAGGLLPGIQGLHIEKVVAIEGDPANEHRTQIEFPLLNGETNTLWARLAMLYTGKETGSYFIPDIDEEVITGFLNNDPCYPVILGSLHSSSFPPPYPLADDNNIRALVTRSALRIEFDEENKIITIQTPGKNQVVLNDKEESIQLTDLHGNNILSNASGITLKSEADVIIQAKTTITLEAGSEIGIKAQADLKLAGSNVEAQAQIGFTTKGTSTAELSASGQTTVKGAIVAIN
ncbi:MAG: phage baseplate assembly protein V [Tannerellaceae bacterium]|nr:phage baseplate assembly protein V [Tannerellaceae bacterium]MCD8263468.1 phage baseplate assembly protein V [Tannerellaceae bacterium]